MTILAPEGGAVAFPSAPDEVARILTEIEKRAKAHVPDVSTVKGRKEIASVAADVARSKTALDAAGKALVEDAKKEVARVDAVRKTIRDTLDALKVEVRKPLTEWEAAEEARKADIERRVGWFRNTPGLIRPNETASEIHRVLTETAAIVVNKETFAEFELDALKAQRDTIDALRGMLEAARTREAEQAELARLREQERQRAEQDAKERAAREEREREERRAKAAAEEAKRARHAAIEEANARVAAAEARAKQAEEAAERAAQAERDRIEREAREAEEAAAAKAKADAEATRAEKERIAAEKAAEEERKANARKYYDEAHAALMDQATITESEAHRVLDAIKQRFIPHVGWLS